MTTPRHPARPALTLVPGALGESITDRIGNTPLLRIRLFERESPEVAVYAKAEFMNPGGSVKDRPALRMIEEGERSGRLTQRSGDPRQHERQHGHRVRDDRRSEGLPGAPGHAEQCQ